MLSLTPAQINPIEGSVHVNVFDRLQCSHTYSITESMTDMYHAVDIHFTVIEHGRGHGHNALLFIFCCFCKPRLELTRFFELLLYGVDFTVKKPKAWR
jgi:hypothetical protein